MNSLKTALRLLVTAGEPSGVNLSDILYRNWTTDADFILDNTHLFNSNPVGRFAYNPKTYELVWGPISEQHSIMIHNQATGSFDDFVRGAYDGSKIMLRWYGTDPYMDPEEVKLQSFNAWYDTKQMLEQNGLPPGMPVEMGVSTDYLKDQFGYYT